MNLSKKNVRTHLETWLNWWIGGWQDAWTQLPKPTALQAHSDVFQTPQGDFQSDSATPGKPATWQSISRSSTLRGVFIDDDQILLRELMLPSLSDRDIAAAVAMDVQIASPFPAHDTRSGHSTHRQPNGALCVEIAITHQSQLEQLLAIHPNLAAFARGRYGAIPLQGDTHSSRSTNLRSPFTLSLLALLALSLIAWIISPTLLLRAESIFNETALAKLNQEATPLLQKREELSLLQQQLESVRTFDNEHPDPVLLLEQLSYAIPDGTWLRLLRLSKNQITLDGSSDNAVAVIGQLEKVPELREVRLGTSVNRDPRTNKEIFQILARTQYSNPSTSRVSP